jgi:pimeloyl-ACP methyl ester carboxylesterase
VEIAYPRTTTLNIAGYARGIELALQRAGVAGGWLLGESFGSQPAWQLIARWLHTATSDRPPTTPATRPPFRPRGLILAGGFVRHPIIPGVRLARRLNAALPRWSMQGLFRVYARYARFRHRRAPETLDCLAAFLTNRLAPGDQEAIVHRLGLIATTDLRPMARRTRLPVYYLAGLVDPLVPFPLVRFWLRNNCPGYRRGRTIADADHNVLATAPQKSASHILDWMQATGPRR